MHQRLIDYLGGVAVGTGLGALGGLCLGDPAGGALVGGVTGVFLGAAVRAWRTRDQRESYEDRGLSE
ncbi:hypothetical protein ACIQC9_06945 [Brevundimonas sp. NPDC092305]|uniref:hypothetical protein n=1 Tax=Brevundimonas sp. NPDC092305 TaxID=3363957 RepID=UPI0037F81D76